MADCINTVSIPHPASTVCFMLLCPFFQFKHPAESSSISQQPSLLSSPLPGCEYNSNSPQIPGELPTKDRDSCAFLPELTTSMCHCFAVDPVPLLLHKGRSAFSQLSSCAFQVLSFLPSAVISSSLAAEGSGRASTHHRRWLISRSTSARGCALPCQHSPPPLPVA